MDKNINRTKNVLRNICISTIILFLGIIVIFKSFKVEPGSKKLLYAYNVNRNVYYNVNLIENDLFEKQTLEMGKTYISSLVDKINMDFSYSLTGNKKSDIKYSYQVIAVSNVKYEDKTNNKEDVIWSKQDVLIESKDGKADGANFTIEDSFDVDFAKYNEEVKKFKEELRIPVIADLQIKLIVRSDANVPGVENTVVENSIMNLKMDLAKDVFTVEQQFENTDNKEISENIDAKKTINKPMLVIGCVLVVAALMITLDAIRRSIKFSKNSDYAIALNRILKNYGDIVAEIVSPVEIDNLNIIDVKNFDQLLDIEEEVRMPILYYETIPDEQGEFIIICDNMAYRYVIG